MRHIALKMRYLGTAYHGWQRQKNAVTVQQTLEEALASVLERPTTALGCGRTDAGVHAEKYCASFFTASSIPLDKLPLAINSRLPDDIAVSEAFEVPDEFHPVFSSTRKEYTYRIINRRVRDPFLIDRAWFCPAPLDVSAMAGAAGEFVGEHDFAAVRSVGTNVKTTIRTVFYFDVSQKNDIIELKVCANGFLYNMARAMSGTVVYAGLGKLAPGEIGGILASGDRRLAGPTLPPGGLYMTGLSYGDALSGVFDG